MVREQWVEGEKNLVSEFSGPWVAALYCNPQINALSWSHLGRYQCTLLNFQTPVSKSNPKYMKLGKPPTKQPKSKLTIRMTQLIIPPLPQISWFYPHIHQVFISTLLNRQILHEVRLEINLGFEHILSRENVGVNAEKLARRWICLNATRMQLGAWLLSGLIWGPCRQSNLVWKAFRGADLCEFCVSF